MSESYDSESSISEGPVSLPGFTKSVTTHPGPPAPFAHRPGSVTHASDEELAALLRCAVRPVVASLLTEEEVEDVELAWGAEPHEREVWVRVVAGGETFSGLLDSADWQADEDRTAAAIAARLADHLEDWVCETTFAWGQRRTARYTLPFL